MAVLLFYSCFSIRELVLVTRRIKHQSYPVLSSVGFRGREDHLARKVHLDQRDLRWVNVSLGCFKLSFLALVVSTDPLKWHTWEKLDWNLSRAAVDSLIRCERGKRAIWAEVKSEAVISVGLCNRAVLGWPLLVRASAGLEWLSQDVLLPPCGACGASESPSRTHEALISAV